jgi:UDP-N-acetylglucosamine 2-epimerase (non-hydrolysing)
MPPRAGTSARRLRLVEGAGGEPAAPEHPAVALAIDDGHDLVRMASVIAALRRRGVFREVVVHTGAEDAGDRGAGSARRLAVAPGTHAERTAGILRAFEEVLVEESPAVVVVPGGGAAMACALAAAKLGVAVAHLEAGLRSGEHGSPDELDRLLTDRLADTLLTHGAHPSANLLLEGVPPGRVHQVGSTAVDALRRCGAPARVRRAWAQLGAPEHGYVLVTLRQPRNVEDDDRLAEVVVALRRLAGRTPVLLALHDGLRERLELSGAAPALVRAGVRLVAARPHLDFLSLQVGAGAIATDSGYDEEEASVLGVACHTLRSATERDLAVSHGTTVLLGDDPARLAAVRPSGRPPTPCAIPLWDGLAGERVADVLVAHYAVRPVAAAGG